MMKAISNSFSLLNGQRSPSFVNFAEEVALSGELEKKGMGMFFKPWAKRHFVYYRESRTLTYTREGSYRGAVVIDEIFAVKDIPENEADGKEFVFEVFCYKRLPQGVDTKRRRLLLSASSEVDRRKWVNSLMGKDVDGSTSSTNTPSMAAIAALASSTKTELPRRSSAPQLSESSKMAAKEASQKPVTKDDTNASLSRARPQSTRVPESPSLASDPPTKPRQPSIREGPREAEVRELTRSLFDALDSRKTGFVGEPELRQFWLKMGTPDNKVDGKVKKDLSQWDFDLDGQLSFPEFYKMNIAKLNLGRKSSQTPANLGDIDEATYSFHVMRMKTLVVIAQEPSGPKMGGAERVEEIKQLMRRLCLVVDTSGSGHIARSDLKSFYMKMAMKSDEAEAETDKYMGKWCMQLTKAEYCRGMVREIGGLEGEANELSHLVKFFTDMPRDKYTAMTLRLKLFETVAAGIKKDLCLADDKEKSVELRPSQRLDDVKSSILLLFQNVDSNRTGFVEKDDLRQFYEKLGMQDEEAVAEVDKYMGKWCLRLRFDDYWRGMMREFGGMDGVVPNHTFQMIHYLDGLEEARYQQIRAEIATSLAIAAGPGLAAAAAGPPPKPSLGPARIASLRAAIQTLFDIADGDKEGFLDRNKLRLLWGKLAPPSGNIEGDIDDFITDGDIDGDGKLSFNEFFDVLKVPMSFEGEASNGAELEGFLDQMDGEEFAGQLNAIHAIVATVQAGATSFASTASTRLREARLLIHKIFSAIDSDNNGYLDKGELQRFYVKMGIATEDVEAETEKFYIGCSHRMNFDQFYEATLKQILLVDFGPDDSRMDDTLAAMTADAYLQVTLMFRSFEAVARSS